MKTYQKLDEQGREDALNELRPFIDFVIANPTTKRIDAIVEEMHQIVHACDEYQGEVTGWCTLDIRLHDQAMADALGLVVERLHEAGIPISFKHPVIAHLLADETIDWRYAYDFLEAWWYIDDRLRRAIKTKFWRGYYLP